MTKMTINSVRHCLNHLETVFEERMQDLRNQILLQKNVIEARNQTIADQKEEISHLKRNEGNNPWSWKENALMAS